MSHFSATGRWSGVLRLVTAF